MLVVAPWTLMGGDALVPQLGDRIPGRAVQLQSQIMSSPSQMRQLCIFDSGAVKWDLGASDTGRIKFVATKDSRFHTPEGIHAGMTYSEVRKRSGKKAVAVHGFAWVIVVPSGWKIAFVSGAGMTDKPLIESTPVSFIYRSDDRA